MSIQVKEFNAYPIDLNKPKAFEAVIPKGAELNSYIQSLIEWADSEEDVRHFKFAKTTTEVHAAILKVLEGNPLAAVAGAIANRLLKHEKVAQKEMAHLKGVHEGMLLQAVFNRQEARGFLLAKVDLSEFLGRKDFRSQSGIDKKHRLLKFCLINFSSDEKIASVHVGDTNASIAAYWWNSFLELDELRTDSLNTKTAFATFDSFLGRSLKKDFPRDYPILFNEVLRKFRRNQTFKFSKFLDEVFDHYQPCDPDLNVAELKKNAKAILEKDKFDANFTIIPKEVEKRFKRTYHLTPQIDITVAGELDNFSEEIAALRLEDGTQGVFIRSDTGYDQFPERKRN